jgi:hypothetical protein
MKGQIEVAGEVQGPGCVGGTEGVAKDKSTGRPRVWAVGICGVRCVEKIGADESTETLDQ